MAGVPVYRGKFGEKQAERLLWRAGFGPKRGEARRLAKKTLREAVRSLTRPPKARLHGPAPHDDDGNPLAPTDAYGHDHLWWLDRMVRSNQPLVERMALIWHDWFATGDVGSLRLGVGQNKLLRKRALGSFKQLLLDVTHDPAMLIWLSGIDNHKDAPNENYGRELMELFTLGASDESGYPYSEDEVREQARALTGWTADYVDDVGWTNFHFEAERHDNGQKMIFGKRGRFNWRDSCTLCLEHKAHKRYFIERLWAHFIPVAPSASTRKALEHLYVSSGYDIRKVVEAILMHPQLYQGPSLVKPPVVLIAGLLRARGGGIDTEAWTWISYLAGMRLFDPPNVSGWNEERWLDTSTFRGRWLVATRIMEDDYIEPSQDYDPDETPKQAIERALHFWGNPTLSGKTESALGDFCRAVEDAVSSSWQEGYFRSIRQNALRMLIATSPDMQAS